MCSRPACPLRISTRRTSFRTRSARTSRTKAFRASTETLTVPGYGRVVVHTPYGMEGPMNAPVRRATSSTTWSGWIMSAPSGRCRPCSSSAPTGTMTTGSVRASAANSSEVISSSRTWRNPRDAINRSWPPKGKLTLNKVNLGAESFTPPWPSDSRAGRGALLGRQGLDVRGVRRDAAWLGRDASPVHRPGGSRLDAVSRAEPPPHAAARGGDGPPVAAGVGERGRGRGTRGVATDFRARPGRRRRGRRDCVGLPARAREPSGAGERPASLRAAVAARPATPRAGLHRHRHGDRLFERLRGRPRRELAGPTLGRRRGRGSSPIARPPRSPSVRRRRRVRDARARRPHVLETGTGRAGKSRMERIRRRLAGLGSPTRTESLGSGPLHGRHRAQVVEEQRAVVVLPDPLPRGFRELYAGGSLSGLPRNREGASQRFVCVSERKVADAMRLAGLETPLGMVQRRLRSADDRVDPGDLPLANCEFFRPAGDAPVVAGGVRHVDHRVRLFFRASFLREQFPGPVEELCRHLPMPFRIRLRQSSGHFESPYQASGAGQI